MAVTTERRLSHWQDQGPDRSTSMPADWYLDPEVFELERRYLFPRTWHIVGWSEEVANPGDYFATDICGERVIVVRDKGGAVRALSNVCRHRGGPVALGRGNRKAFQCAYHGWVYDLDGRGRRCLGMEAAPEFDARDLQLPQFGAATWGHWVFVTLSDEAPPFEEWLGHVMRRTKNYQVDKLVWHGTRRWKLPINWKTMNDANHEAYHVPFIHAGLSKAYNVVGGYGTPGEGTNAYTQMATAYGGEIYVTEPNPRGPFSKVIAALGGTMDYRQLKPPMPSLEGPERNGHYFLFNWPGLSQFHLMPDGIVLIKLIPLEPRVTGLELEWWMPPATRLDEKLLQAALIVFGNETLDEDSAMTQVQEKGLASWHYSSGRYAPVEENLLYEYHRWYAAQMESVFSGNGR